MPIKTFTFSASANFGRYDHLGNLVKRSETKTITWTVRSASAITGGTFLDGSPWVQDNGDLELIDVTPAPELSISNFSVNYPDGFVRSDGITLSPEDMTRDIETEFWKNQTVINPDFGKVVSKDSARVSYRYIQHRNSDPNDGLTAEDARFWTHTVDYITPCNPNHPVNDPTNPIDEKYLRILTAGSLGTADFGGETVGLYLNDPGMSAGSDIEPAFFFGFDGRGGLVAVAGNNDNAPGNLTVQGGNKSPIGTFYNKASTQIWDRSPTSIEAGDMIVSSISHQEPYFGWGRDQAEREGIMDMYGVLTVVSSQRATTASERFRPPVNWDPTDKENRPFYKERTIPENLLLDKPDRGIDDTTATNPFSDIALKDFYDPEKTDGRTLRTGTVVVWVGDGEWDDTYQGYGRSFCRAPREYGSEEGYETEPMFLLTMDATLTDAERKTYRRILAQRGLDLYGGYRSLGKYFRPNGGHAEPHEFYIIAADMFTIPEESSSELYNLEDLMNGIVGNTGNGTLKSLGSNIPLSEVTDWTGATNGIFALGIQGMSHYRAQSHHFGVSADIEFGGRVSNATVASTGASGSNGVDVPWIILEPPIPSNGSTGGDKSNDSLGFFCGDDQRRNGGSIIKEGRWGNTSNIPYLRPENNFVGNCIRNNTTGECARIIRDEPQGEAAVSTYGGSYYTDENVKVYYTPGITFNVGDKVDFAPVFEEELGTGRAWFGGVNAIRNINSNAGVQQYGWGVYRCLPVYSLYKNIMIASGRSGLPKWWEGCDQRTEGILTDSLRRYGVLSPDGGVGSSYFHPLSTRYPTGWANFYQAYLRKAVLGTGPCAPLYDTLDELYNGLSGDIGTWIPYDANPSNPTVLLGDGSVGGYGGVNDSPWKTIDGSTMGTVQRLNYRDYIDNDGDYRDAIFVSSNDARPLPYSDYVEGKSLYVWISGRNSPIEFIKVEEDTTSDTIWTQLWAMDDETKILPKTRPLGTDLLSSMTIFYADPSVETSGTLYLTFGITHSGYND